MNHKKMSEVGLEKKTLTKPSLIKKFKNIVDSNA